MSVNLFKCMLVAVVVLTSFPPTISVAADEKQPAKSKIPPGLDKLLRQVRTADTAKGRYDAARRIGKEFGPKALPALPIMLDVLGGHVAAYNPYRQPSERWGIGSPMGNSIVAIGPKAVPPLIDIAKKTKKPAIRAAAIKMMARIGHKRGKDMENKIWPILTKGLNDSSPLVRYHTLFATGYFSERVRDIWPTILRLVKDQTPITKNGPVVGTHAANAVFGAAYRGQLDLAEQGLPHLIEYADSPNKYMARICVRAMGQVGRKIPSLRVQIYRPLIKIFKKRDDVRPYVLGSLNRIDAISTRDLSVFQACLRDHKKISIETQIALLHRFEKMGRSAADVVPDIEALLKSTKNYQVRRYAIVALGAIDHPNPGLVKFLKLLSKTDPNSRVRSEAEALLRQWL